jgi:hypothetical protein
MVKDYTTPSTTKIDIFQKKIDTIKINNSLLNKKKLVSLNLTTFFFSFIFSSF